MTFSPLAVFVYNRPRHALRTLDALRANAGFDQTEIHVFSDGPRGPDDISGVEEVRDGVEALGLENVRLHRRSHNLGLSGSIRAGVDEVLSRADRVIVLEDDLVAEPGLLQFLNSGLDRYAHDERVRSLNGFMYPGAFASTSRAVLLPYMSSWSWATWRRSWEAQRLSLAQAEVEFRKSYPLRRDLDLRGVYPYYLALRRVVAAGGEEFALRFAVNVFLDNGLSVWPSTSLVHNIGFDGSGDHSRRSRPRRAPQEIGRWSGNPPDFPVETQANVADITSFCRAVARFYPRWYRLAARLSELF